MIFIINIILFIDELEDMSTFMDLNYDVLLESELSLRPLAGLQIPSQPCREPGAVSETDGSCFPVQILGLSPWFACRSLSWDPSEPIVKQWKILKRSSYFQRVYQFARKFSELVLWFTSQAVPEAPLSDWSCIQFIESTRPQRTNWQARLTGDLGL